MIRIHNTHSNQISEHCQEPLSLRYSLLRVKRNVIVFQTLNHTIKAITTNEHKITAHILPFFFVKTKHNYVYSKSVMVDEKH